MVRKPPQVHSTDVTLANRKGFGSRGRLLDECRINFGGARSAGQAAPMICPTPDFYLGLHRAGTPPRYPRLHREEPAKGILADESREWPSGSRVNPTRVSL